MTPTNSLVSAGLQRTIPALPVRDVRAAAAHYQERFGFDVLEELRGKGVLHEVSRSGVDTTDFGTREFATVDLDGNLLTFFRWVEA
jgi:uncharacterized glyoxalase superfamily protein PhnB